MRRVKIFTFIALLLVSFLIATVHARGGAYTVEPTQEVTDTVKLGISDGVVGNVSVSDGVIDFYVTSPSGFVLLWYKKTSFDTFNFTAEENGIYTMHLANTNLAENVTVILNYAVNFVIVVQTSIKLDSSIGTAHVIGTLATPFDWIGFLRTVIPLIPGLGYLGKAVKKFWDWLNWKKKYGKSRTPVVIKHLKG